MRELISKRSLTWARSLPPACGGQTPPLRYGLLVFGSVIAACANRTGAAASLSLRHRNTAAMTHVAVPVLSPSPKQGLSCKLAVVTRLRPSWPLNSCIHTHVGVWKNRIPWVTIGFDNSRHPPQTWDLCSLLLFAVRSFTLAQQLVRLSQPTPARVRRTDCLHFNPVPKQLLYSALFQLRVISPSQ